ncbi:hypothetical protein H6F98_20965 [Microcoleus sp. FACHB-SPT15]|uniref:hypothetical protein n=1 Tax=Microcoleus sp. FACHB-SPT15 TaxID=2692830 RepID=UPI001781087B|nr:hypothetical protein [Microcoleus sp. FACHB-SPT15]MBD1807903.1 hypothetical protein [Microcoleus sp. FACHB-SPT15]
MDYWEFLLQKEGDRSWRPIKSPKFKIEAGRYRVVAHSSCTNTDVEICVMHECTEEDPPKRRFQKRSRRTNPEGLMVVIPFTYLKPGSWELRCCGDIMSDLLGKSWKKAVRLEVLSKASEVLQVPESVAPITDITQAELIANSPSNHLSQKENQELRESNEITSLNGSEASQKGDEGDEIISALPSPSSPPSLTKYHSPVALALSNNQDEIMEETKDLGANQEQFTEEQLDLEMDQLMEDLTSLISEVDSVPAPQLNEAKLATTTDKIIPLHPVERNNNPETPVAATNNPAEVTAAANPILDQSLQMLEQILQQVLEPVLQEFDRPEPSSQETSETPDADFSEEVVNEQGVMLTLNEDALVARRGEPLTITGQVDALEVNQLSNGEQSSPLNSIFHGTLRYELRDPQTLQVLLNVEQPLPEQELPLAFRHTLEIPPDCNTRLILGKAVLYGSSSRALASQPFSVTADLDELLGAIIPASKAMPVAKMLVLSNKLAAAEELQEELSEPAPPPLNQALLDLVDAPKSHQPISLQPASRQPLPPQLNKSAPEKFAPTPKASKFLQLPKLPKVPPVALSVPEPVEVEPVEALEQAASLQDVGQLFEEGTSEDDIVVADSSASTWDAISWSDSSVSVIDSGIDTPEVAETIEPSALTNSQLDTSETIDVPATVTPDVDSQESESDAPELEKSTEAPVANDSTTVDSAFQALNLQDRFWLRLNSLAADAELSEWLKFELSPSHPPTDEEDVPPQNDAPLADDLEVTEQLNSDGLLADFDESMWEGSDDVGNIPAEVDQLQPPNFEEETASEAEELAEPPLVEVETIDWTAQEIVVEDEEELTQQPEVKHDASGMAYPTEVVSSEPKPEPLSPQELESPLPAPVLLVPTTELAAGEPVIIRIKLPPHPTRLCIKLWLQDRQSRSLLDGPRWLVDLLPDGAGNLEAMTQLLIPFGTTEIRFEAIAVDIYSQRESHKVTVDCVVVPPDMPDFSLDDFET